VAALKKPRRVVILVKAGKPVDETIDVLAAHMEAGDMIVDGGNEWYPNTLARGEKLRPRGIRFVGMGVSGGEEGARHGPSLMPGCERDAYDALEPVLRKIAAQTDSGPCVTWCGELGAGNYVKMVHNGIEYGDMQLIAEVYDVLKTLKGLDNDELSSIFAEWNRGELQSYLVEITSQIFARRDVEESGAETADFVVDKILDKTGMKGTGRWTVQEAAERSVAAPTIASALDMRIISALKEQREATAARFPAVEADAIPRVDKAQLVADLRKALYAAKICSYAQGMQLIAAAAAENEWSINLAECARIWKGGCIIRARFLDRIRAAFERSPDLPSLLLDPEFASEILDALPHWRRVVTLAVACGIPTPALSASLQYFYSVRRARLPANLTQAQRDFFGAHSYQRTDKPGDFHTEWLKHNPLAPSAAAAAGGGAASSAAE
jgi:6-phosphogluconate dehydrogenase